MEQETYAVSVGHSCETGEDRDGEALRATVEVHQ